MSDVIRLLPDSVANQIAAGEVIQRPASVIKELVENAVDAGATDIRIYIKDAGRTLIQVVDNGKGMTETDARMAFERHATSKITQASDLFTLHTMGFRGEALPSICAISQVELKTRVASTQLGTRLLIAGTKVESQEPCTCDAGTNIMVRNLFFNVPARRKFLKSDSTELTNIIHEFERLALVNNNLRMLLDTGTGRLIDLRAASFRQRITDLWKNTLNPQLIPVEVDTSLVKVSGFISRPEFARRRNALQYLIVNGRNMQHPYFRKAVMSCYEHLIAADTQPCFFLRFEVDPKSIDVNISPTKSEIKFEYESEIWPILSAAVKAALGKYGAVPSIDFNSDVLPLDPLRKGETPEAPQLDIPAGYNPFEAMPQQPPSASPFADVSSGTSFPRESSCRAPAASGSGAKPAGGSSAPLRGASQHAQDPKNWESLYERFMRDTLSHAESRGDADRGGVLPDMEETAASSAPLCVQHALRYIVTSMRSGLVVIDQHRAHVKVLYEGYLERMRGAGYPAQGVMFPETVRLDEPQRLALSEAESQLDKLGFRLEYLEEDQWQIVSVPSVLRNVSAGEVVGRILDSVSDRSIAPASAGEVAKTLMQRVALGMARSMAVKRGRRLSADEMEHLVADLFALPDPSFTPGGKRIFHVLDDATMQAFFT